MESHPLNMAHQQHRRAEAHLMNKKFDEAMQCHHNAAELLLDAMKSTASSVALESITLQHSYHLKQKDLIKTKKEQFERVQKTMETIKLLGKDPLLNANSELPVAIYRAMNETDSLLKILSTKKEVVEQGILKDKAAQEVLEGRKIAKSQQTVVEELQILNQNLHSLVEQLVLQVEVLKDENTTLKEKVCYLEKERVKYLNLSSSDDLTFKSNYLSSAVTEDQSQDPEAIVSISPSVKTTSKQIEQPNLDSSLLTDEENK